MVTSEILVCRREREYKMMPKFPNYTNLKGGFSCIRFCIQEEEWIDNEGRDR